MLRSHDKKQAKLAHNKGAVGRLISIDPWGNSTCILIAKGADVQDPELVSGLQPKTGAVDCLRLSKPRIAPDGWTRDAVNNLANRWQAIYSNSRRKGSWLRVDTGQTQHSSSSLAEVKSAATDDGDDTRIAYWGEFTGPGNNVVRPEVVDFLPPPDKPVQVCDALTKTVPKARVIPNRVVMSTTGAQYERWKQATSKEL